MMLVFSSHVLRMIARPKNTTVTIAQERAIFYQHVGANISSAWTQSAYRRDELRSTLNVLRTKQVTAGRFEIGKAGIKES